MLDEGMDLLFDEYVNPNNFGLEWYLVEKDEKTEARFVFIEGKLCGVAIVFLFDTELERDVNLESIGLLLEMSIYLL